LLFLLEVHTQLQLELRALAVLLKLVMVEILFFHLLHLLEAAAAGRDQLAAV
jgi:hypothetical protein